MASNFTFDTNKFKSPRELDRRLQRAVFGVAKYWDGRIEAHAKQKAPWTDRTTNARNGLKAEAVKVDSNTFAIILSHAVNYGIWLERANEERFAIIMPTIRLYAPKVVRTLNKIMDRL